MVHGYQEQAVGFTVRVSVKLEYEGERRQARVRCKLLQQTASTSNAWRTGIQTLAQSTELQPL